MLQTQEHQQTPSPTVQPQKPLMQFGWPLGKPLTEHQEITQLNLQQQVQASHTQTIKMFKMFATICAVTMLECTTLHEDPPKTFATKAECEKALIIKKEKTIEMLTDEDGYLTVAHLEIGCTNVYH